jgi:hypothetical protein
MLVKGGIFAFLLVNVLLHLGEALDRHFGGCGMQF